MDFVPFYKYFPDVAKRETRELIVNSKSSTLSGGYGLLECYCKDPECDCRRVMFNIISEREKKVVAVVNFGWENENFYEKWLGGKKWFGDKVETIIEEMKGPSLNSASRQSEYAPELLHFIRTIILKDSSYVDRLKRHYKMFKEKMREENPNQEKIEVESSAGYKPGRNDPCPCGSGKKYKKCCASSNISSLREDKENP